MLNYFFLIYAFIKILGAENRPKKRALAQQHCLDYNVNGFEPVDEHLYSLVDSCGEECVVLPQLGIPVVGQNSNQSINIQNWL